MPKIDLQKRIDQLKLKGGAAFGQFKSSRKVLYQTFAESYLLWRECEASPGFLEKEYKKARITFQKFNDNRVNFVPFVKLIFGIKNPTGADKNMRPLERTKRWYQKIIHLSNIYSNVYVFLNASKKIRQIFCGNKEAKMSDYFKFIFIIIFLVRLSPLQAAESQPTFGFLYNEREDSSLSYKCKPTAFDQI